ncbi:MAG: hypothetical protein Q8916_12185 [Bacteroidota bacterium]|nr:hypothetical protein [Bacteroidota bacterium]MDP4231151.1 hypothetical protein [Bacteroidota bacterium]MDP4236080.1 hypothetical protein [Bacteroidota bacterium]
MKKIILVLLAALMTVSLVSCGANYAVTGNYNMNNTQVQLSTANFNVVDKVSGSAHVSYVLFIGGIGEHQLYENAYSAMMAKADLSKGSRAIGNVVTEEQVEGFIPFYWTRTITVSANVIEFTK